jgi:hypothetical protein
MTAVARELARAGAAVVAVAAWALTLHLIGGG